MSNLNTEYHYGPILSSVSLQTILFYRADGTCNCRQVNHHASQSALGTPARRRIAVRPRAAGAALSTSTQSRFCPRAPRPHNARLPRTACAAYRVRRADAHTAARLPRATQTAYTTSQSVPAGGQVIRPQRLSICALQRPVHRLPPKQPTSGRPPLQRQPKVPCSAPSVPPPRRAPTVPSPGLYSAVAARPPV